MVRIRKIRRYRLERIKWYIVWSASLTGESACNIPDPLGQGNRDPGGVVLQWSPSYSMMCLSMVMATEAQ